MTLAKVAVNKTFLEKESLRIVKTFIKYRAQVGIKTQHGH
jgi:hypothetical protein